MKKTIHNLLLMLALVLFLGVRADAASVVLEGQCGDNASYVFTDDGVLTITGTGAMYDYVSGGGDKMNDYADGAAPWAGTPWIDEEYWEINSDDAAEKAELQEKWENVLRPRTVIVGEGITYIGTHAFSSCTFLETVQLPSTLTGIGGYAFKSCGKMTTINFPAGLKTVGDYAFHWCKGLTELNLPAGLANIGKGAFAYCTYVDSLSLPTSLTDISEEAFMRLENLDSLTIPAGVTSIGPNAFFGCFSLESVDLPSSLKSIGYQGFGWCYDLGYVILPEGFTTIGEAAFWKCKDLWLVSFPSSLKTIGPKAFEDCAALSSITLPVTLTEVPYRMATGCASLTEITIPASVTKIGEYAFGQTGLTAITIPAGVQTIGNYAFDQCTELTQVTFEGDAPSIASSAFLDTDGVEILYPRSGSGWAALVGSEYGGSLSWKAYGEASPTEPTEPETPKRPSESYSDVDQNQWYVTAIDYVLENNIMSGLPGMTFGPNNELTRGMIAVMIYARSGNGAVGTGTFTDVAASDWYANAAAWVQEKNIMTGYPDGSFRPNQYLTRQELAVTFRSYGVYLGKDMSLSGDMSQFADADSIAFWAYDAVRWAVGAGIIGTMDGSNMAPGGTATRAQAAQMFMKFLEG